MVIVGIVRFEGELVLVDAPRRGLGKRIIGDSGLEPDFVGRQTLAVNGPGHLLGLKRQTCSVCDIACLVKGLLEVVVRCLDPVVLLVVGFFVEPADVGVFWCLVLASWWWLIVAHGCGLGGGGMVENEMKC